jgi:hypothetical protein
VTPLSDGHDLYTTSSQPQHSASADDPRMSDSDQPSPHASDVPSAPPYVPPPLPPYAAHDQPSAREPRTPFRDRVIGLRAVIAVALACVVLGGVGGTVLGATTNGGDDRFGGPGAFPGGGPGQGFQPGQQGRLPQGQAPNGG